MEDSISCIRTFADKNQIERCRDSVAKAAPSVNMLSSALNLAGNKVRLNILFLLYKEAELCVCDISDILNMTTPAVSQHLRKMRDGGIIKYRKEASTIYYSLESEHFELFENFFLLISKNEVLKKVS